MRNQFLVVGSMCVLLLSVLGCSTDKSSTISTTTEDRQTIIEKAVSETPALEKDNNTDSASPVIEVAKSTEKEIPVESAASETLQVYDLEEGRPMEPESHVIGDSPKEPEPIMPPEDVEPRQKETVQSEVVQQEPEESASEEPTEPTEPRAPIEPSTEPQSKSAYDYPFDINVIRSDCIAIGESIGYTLNTSLTPQNATWWNPVTASESNQGDTLRTFLEQYIRFHTVSNFSAYGLDEITEFNICCEANGDGYTIYFVFA